MHVCVRTRTHVCVCVHVCACVHTRVCVCVCVSTRLSALVRNGQAFWHHGLNQNGGMGALQVPLVCCFPAPLAHLPLLAATAQAQTGESTWLGLPWLTIECYMYTAIATAIQSQPLLAGKRERGSCKCRAGRREGAVLLHC